MSASLLVGCAPSGGLKSAGLRVRPPRFKSWPACDLEQVAELHGVPISLKWGSKGLHLIKLMGGPRGQ